MSLADKLVEAWYTPRVSPMLLPLLPFAAVFGQLAGGRRLAYRRGWLSVRRLPVPVCVVGNITVGGTGKTPMVIALAEGLAARGWSPGLITRGHGGSSSATRRVRPEDSPAVAGDEALLLAASGFPVWAGADRVAAGEALLRTQPECDVLLADDGLQHYRLARSAELAVIDAARGLGNGLLLPAGPLREPASRLAEVDAVVWHESAQAQAPAGARWVMRLEGDSFRQVAAPANEALAAAFFGKRIVAVAAIGNPQRFFVSLAACGLSFTAQAFPDHHAYRAADLAFPEAEVILMTAKDAVKCRDFADPRLWYLPVRASLPPGLVELLEEKLRGSQTA
ncbi:MAG: tetraacyldisaccharide 4'-kinase [Burkholderiales bacterium]|nr:MAG: tetraacyldisaccharide 4'-kinase [Burkholderiales bacterium]